MSFGYRGLCDSLSSRVQMETRRLLSLAAVWFLCPVCSWSVPLWPGFRAKVVVSPVSLRVIVILGDQLTLGRILK